MKLISEHDFFVCFTIVVGVFKKPDVWCSANEDATIVAKDRCSVRDVIGEDGTFIVNGSIEENDQGDRFDRTDADY